MLSDLGELPRGARVCLYGAGQGGASFRRLLAARRPDVAVVAFVDDFRGGTAGGLPVLTPAGLEAQRGRFDLVLVTSTYWRDIAARLRDEGRWTFRVVDPVLYFAEHVFDAAQAARLAPRFAAARALLARPEDRELYDLVVANRLHDAGGGSDPLACFKRTVPAPREYLDFVATEGIRTVVEGGVMDGRETLQFLEALRPRLGLYGFEPLIEAYERGAWREQIARHPNCEVLALALWERRERLRFEIDPANDAGGTVVGSGAAGRVERWVDAVSLDEFAAERGLTGVDFVKLDIEGAEPEALRGARGVIARDRPQLAVCIYHRKEHLCELPLLIAELLPDAVHRIAHYASSFWDTVWYAIPRERYRGARPDRDEG